MSHEPVDISKEEWREYVLHKQVYRITNPKSLVLNENSTIHRITDAEGVVHCVPAPGIFETVVRYYSKDPKYVAHVP